MSLQDVKFVSDAVGILGNEGAVRLVGAGLPDELLDSLPALLQAQESFHPEEVSKAAVVLNTSRATIEKATELAETCRTMQAGGAVCLVIFSLPVHFALEGYTPLKVLMAKGEPFRKLKSLELGVGVAFRLSSLAELCTHPYVSLQPFFLDVGVNQLGVEVFEEDLVNAVPREKTLLATRFVRSVLKQHFEKDPFDQDAEEMVPAKPHLDEKAGRYALSVNRGVLNLSQKVRSVLFSHFPRVTPLLNISQILSLAKEDKVDWSTLKCIDMSSTNLFDQDVESIVELLTHLHTEEKVAELVLRLSNNRFINPDEPFRQLLALPFVKFVDVCANQLGSVRNAAFLRSMDKETAAKFIFIPKAWLKDQSWYGVVAEDNRMIVLQAHTDYFKWVDELGL